MSRKPMNPTQSFLHDIEAVYRAQPVHLEGIEHIKQEVYLFLSVAIRELMRTYYAEHLTTLDALHHIWRRNNTVKIEGAYLKAIEDVKISPIALLPQSVVNDHAVHAKEHPEMLFETIDQQFTEVRETVHATQELIAENASEVEKKQSERLHHQVEKIDHDYQSVALGGFMIVSGILMVGLTHGVGAAAGAACMMEGMEKIVHAAGHAKNKSQLPMVQFDQNIAELLDKLTKVDEANHAAINEAWIKLIEAHCHAQKKLLLEMKSLLQAESSESHDLINKIDALIADYEHHEVALTKANTVEDARHQFAAIKNVVSTIEATEKSDETQSTIRAVKEKLPQNHTAPDHFLIRAKNFYESNKKIIHFTSLMALSIVGVALTVATGGIAGVMGAAILGAVAFNSGKSVLSHLKNALMNSKSVDPHALSTEKNEKTILHHAQEDWIDVGVMHCERQEKSARKISDALDVMEHPHVKETLDHASKEFKAGAVAYHRLKENDTMHAEEKNHAIAKVSESVHKTNEQVEHVLTQSGDNLPESVKSETRNFKNRAAHFYESHKKIVQSIGKITLAVAAMTVIGVATGGVGFAVAFGFAVASFLVKKAAEKVASIKLNMQLHHDEHEEEGKRHAEKNEDVKTDVQSQHL